MIMKIFDKFGNLIAEIVPVSSEGGCLGSVVGFVVLIAIIKLAFKRALNEILYLGGKIPPIIYSVGIIVLLLALGVFLIGLKKFTKIIIIILLTATITSYVAAGIYCKQLENKIATMAESEKTEVVDKLFLLKHIGYVSSFIKKYDLTNTSEYKYLDIKKQMFLGKNYELIDPLIELMDYKDCNKLVKKVITKYLSGNWERYPVLTISQKDIYERYMMEKNPKVGYLRVRSSYFKYSGGSKLTIEGVELAGDGQQVDGYIYQVNGFKSNGEVYLDIIIQAPQGIGILSNKVSLKRFSIHNLRENSFEDEEDTLYIKS